MFHEPDTMIDKNFLSKLYKAAQIFVGQKIQPEKELMRMHQIFVMLRP
jgi:hypothetical protein